MRALVLWCALSAACTQSVDDGPIAEDAGTTSAADGSPAKDAETALDGTAPEVDAGSDPFPDAQPQPMGEIVFDLSVLHEIDIAVEDQYLDRLENDRENRVPCTFTFDGIVVTNVGIRQKGGYGSSSSLSGKPGFSVKLNDFVAGQKLDGLKKLLLNNAQEDATFLSEHIGYEAYRRAGLAAPFTSHGIVTLNGFTYGIFVVKEPISNDFLERNFTLGNGNLYEGGYHPEDQSLGDFVEHPELLDLKDEVEEMRTRDDIFALAAAIRDTPDDQFVAVVSMRMDLDRYVRSFALDAFLGYWDSYAFFLNNFYLYDNPVDARFVYVPHGMDQLQYQTLSSPLGRFAQRVHEIPELDQQYDDELADIRSSWDVDAMQARIDRVAEVLHSTARTDDHTTQDLASFDGNVDSVRAAMAALKQ